MQLNVWSFSSFRWGLQRPWPGLVRLALFEVFRPQSEGRDTILTPRDALREEV